MKKIIFKAVPFDKDLVTLALESGIDAVLADKEYKDAISALGRVTVITSEEMPTVEINGKSDEETVVALAAKGIEVALAKVWEIIPVENVLAQVESLALEVESLARATLAAGVLEPGADTIVVLPEGAGDLKSIVAEFKLSQGSMGLCKAVVTKIEPAGLGHRVCVDTISMLKRGQGLLVGNSSAFTFLVHAETESNPYVAARPFRVNAGSVHAYVQMPGDRTAYLAELSSGSEVLIVDSSGKTTTATVGRSKVEVRPMLLITAEFETPEGMIEGKVFLQNAETIRVVNSEGDPVSVVTVKPGDEIMCRLDDAGRHFGMRISEEIVEE